MCAARISYLGLTKEDLKTILRASGVPEEHIKEVEEPQTTWKPLEDLINRTIKPFVEGIFKRFVGDMRKISQNIIEGKLVDAAKVALPYAISAIAATVAIELLQTKFAGFGLDLRKTVDKIDRLISPELIFSALIGVMIGRGVELPGVYLFNSLFTPEIPSEQDIFQMYCEGFITKDEAYRLMRFHGKSDKFTDKLFTIWDFTPSWFAIERFYRYYPPPEDVLEEFFRKNRIINPKHKKYYKEYLNWLLIRDEFDRIGGAIRDLYVNGYISEEDFMEVLNYVIKTKVEREAIKQYADIVREKNLLKYYVNKNIYLYRHGVITELELLDRLKELGLDSDFAEAIVEYEAARKGKEWYPSGEAPS